jgi:hypothetical protein
MIRKRKDIGLVLSTFLFFNELTLFTPLIERPHWGDIDD